MASALLEVLSLILESLGVLLVGLNELNLFVRVVVGDQAARLFVLVLERNLLLDNAVGVGRLYIVHTELHEVALLRVLGCVWHYLRRRVVGAWVYLQACVRWGLAV